MAFKQLPTHSSTYQPNHPLCQEPTYTPVLFYAASTTTHFPLEAIHSPIHLPSLYRPQNSHVYIPIHPLTSPSIHLPSEPVHSPSTFYAPLQTDSPTHLPTLKLFKSTYPSVQTLDTPTHLLAYLLIHRPTHISLYSPIHRLVCQFTRSSTH